MRKYFILRITTNILIVTIVIGLAISYISKLINFIPDVSFLEAVGLYCLWSPVHHLLTTFFPSESKNPE